MDEIQISEADLTDVERLQIQLLTCQQQLAEARGSLVIARAQLRVLRAGAVGESDEEKIGGTD